MSNDDAPEIPSTVEVDDVVICDWPATIGSPPPAGWTRVGTTNNWWKRITVGDIRNHPLARSATTDLR